MILVQQLPLFPDLSAPAEPPRQRAPGQRRGKVAEWVQLALQFVLRALERDDVPDEFERPVVHAVVKAAEVAPVQTRGIPSVFSLADAADAARLLRTQGRFGDAASFEVPRYGITVRDGGVTRHIARRADETEEWAEKERIRRAKQRPPRPPRQSFKLKKSRTFADQEP